MNPKQTKVLVAMSGGVDSSVAALMMKRAGYQVIGAFMKNYSDSNNKTCTWKEDRKEAIKIASLLKIPLVTLDFEKEYRSLVVDEMFKLYKKGITPNPDVDCNQKIKFPLLRKAAKKLGADYVVTGHYAQIKKHKEKFQLLRGLDETKDQSYFLYRLNQQDLKNTLFPIGEYTKKQIRAIAKRNKFPNAERKGTVGICFIGKVNLKKFLQEKIKPKKGKILNPEGKQIGEHDGIYYYTIGQRIGPRFGIEVSKLNDKKDSVKKWYVARKNPRKNEITAAPEGHPLLYRKEIIIKKPHWIAKEPKPQKLHARIRQVGELLPCKLSALRGGGRGSGGKQFKVTLTKPITGVSEGQALVLYKGRVCIGGGVIGFEN